MFQINAPKKYIREAKLLNKAADFFTHEEKLLIVGGKKALTAVEDSFLHSLKKEKIKFTIVEFKGHCTDKNIQSIVKIAKNERITTLVAVGGGSVLDTAKAAAEAVGIPIITIPTVAATCAAWSALSVIYSEEGAVESAIILKQSPKLILVDTSILVKAPVRFLQSGIADTLVKWYEFAPHYQKDKYDFAFETSIHIAKLALQILNEHSYEAIQNNKEHKITSSFEAVVDAIISLAGLVGSITGDPPKEQFAHLIHNVVTKLPETKTSLHGEKVIFGLIAQFVLENKSDHEIISFINYLKSLNLPVTLSEIGITDNIEEKIHQLFKDIRFDSLKISALKFPVNAVLLENAILKANELGHKVLDLSR